MISGAQSGYSRATAFMIRLAATVELHELAIRQFLERSGQSNDGLGETLIGSSWPEAGLSVRIRNTPESMPKCQIAATRVRHSPPLPHNSESLESTPILDSEEPRRAPQSAVPQKQLRNHKILGFLVNKRRLCPPQ